MKTSQKNLKYKVSKKFVELRQSNKTDQKNEHHIFWWWLQDNFSCNMIMKLTRFVDTDARSFSLTNLLKKLKNYDYLSEKNFFQTVFSIRAIIDKDLSILNEQFEQLIEGGFKFTKEPWVKDAGQIATAAQMDPAASQ